MHEDSKSASLTRFHELISDDDDTNVSVFVLELVRELMTNQHKPEHQITATGVADPELSLKVIHWLARERIVMLADGIVQLTPAARQSLTIAAETHPQLSSYLLDNTHALDKADANLMVLAILKAHFIQRRSCTP